MMRGHAVSLVVLLIGQCQWCTCVDRTITWWYDVGENTTVDSMNIETIRTHTSVFSRVSPYYGSTVTLDGNASNWWGHDKGIAEWNDPLIAMGIPVVPYLIDTSNSTEMHMVYANSTAFTADAVKIAQHYGFAGWFIDYEDEAPPDTDPHKSQKLKAFLDELGTALHAANKSLTICVASWSSLLADQETLARSAADELQNMDTYSRPGNFEAEIHEYFDKVKAGDNGSTRKAGVGIGVYYDGKGYDKEWGPENATSFVKFVTAQGGNKLDIYRLYTDGEDDWPSPFWWDVLGAFMNHTI